MEERLEVSEAGGRKAVQVAAGRVHYYVLYHLSVLKCAIGARYMVEDGQADAQGVKS